MLYKYKIEIRDASGNILYKTENEYELDRQVMLSKLTNEYEITKANRIKMKLGPEDAFGKRDPNLIKVYPVRIFGDDIRKIVPGAIVMVNNIKGRVIAINSGRVMVDHNHPFAGLTLDVDVEILGKIEDPEEAITEINRYHNIGLEIKKGENGIIIEGDEEKKQLLKKLIDYYGIEYEQL